MHVVRCGDWGAIEECAHLEPVPVIDPAESDALCIAVLDGDGYEICDILPALMKALLASVLLSCPDS